METQLQPPEQRIWSGVGVGVEDGDGDGDENVGTTSHLQRFRPAPLASDSEAIILNDGFPIASFDLYAPTAFSPFASPSPSPSPSSSNNINGDESYVSISTGTSTGEDTITLLSRCRDLRICTSKVSTWFQSSPHCSGVATDTNGILSPTQPLPTLGTPLVALRVVGYNFSTRLYAIELDVLARTEAGQTAPRTLRFKLTWDRDVRAAFKHLRRTVAGVSYRNLLLDINARLTFRPWYANFREFRKGLPGRPNHRSVRHVEAVLRLLCDCACDATCNFCDSATLLIITLFPMFEDGGVRRP